MNLKIASKKKKEIIIPFLWNIVEGVEVWITNFVAFFSKHLLDNKLGLENKLGFYLR